MKKVFIAAALAAMIVSCGSKGNKSAEIIAESESDSIFAVNDSTLGELQTYSYEGIPVSYTHLTLPTNSLV